MSLRKLIGRFTSPVFVPLRKLVVWGDENFGTCDHKLSVIPRESLVSSSESGDDCSDCIKPQISELQKKVSKDIVNLDTYVSLVEPIGKPFPPQELIEHLKENRKDAPLQ